MFDPSVSRPDTDGHVEKIRQPLCGSKRPSSPPERLLRVLLLQIFYSVRSVRLLLQQLDYNLLFRWFVGMAMDEPMWNHALFSENRERLLNQKRRTSFPRASWRKRSLTCPQSISAWTER